MTDGRMPLGRVAGTTMEFPGGRAKDAVKILAADGVPTLRLCTVSAAAMTILDHDRSDNLIASPHRADTDRRASPPTEVNYARVVNSSGFITRPLKAPRRLVPWSAAGSCLVVWKSSLPIPGLTSSHQAAMDTSAPLAGCSKDPVAERGSRQQEDHQRRSAAELRQWSGEPARRS